MQRTLILSFIVLSISYDCSNQSSQNTALADESAVELENIDQDSQQPYQAFHDFQLKRVV